VVSPNSTTSEANLQYQLFTPYPFSPLGALQHVIQPQESPVARHRFQQPKPNAGARKAAIAPGLPKLAPMATSCGMHPLVAACGKVTMEPKTR
jgi:hypothetical protein